MPTLRNLIKTAPVLALFCTVFLLPVLSAGAIQHEGQTYLSLQSIASRLGMEHKWLKYGERVQLSSKWTKLEFEVNQRAASINGIAVYLGHPVLNRGKTLFLSSSDYEKTIQPLLTPQVFPNPPSLRRIAIDAGHGGKDNGAENKALNLREKNLTLDLSRRIKVILEKRGYDVVLTRNDDRYIDLAERPAIAARARADLFISIHFNAAESSKVSGAETYALAPADQPSTGARSANGKVEAGNAYDPWNVLLAYYIQRELVTDLKTVDRGVKRSRFAVLRDAHCPGVLIEGGFLSSSQEGRNIGWNDYRERMAQAIADGIDAYARTLERLRNP